MAKRAPNPLDAALGARIRDVRKTQRPFVSLKWLARELNCTIGQLQKYEHGLNRISFSRLCEIAAALDMDVIELIRPVVPKKRGP